MLKRIAIMVLALALTTGFAWAKPEINDLNVVNVTPVKATVFFRTAVPCIAKVIYHAEDKVNYLAKEDTAGLMHAVEVKGLEEATEYFYKIKLVDEKGGVLGELEADEYSFITAKHSIAMPSNIYGKFRRRQSCHPCIRKICKLPQRVHGSYGCS